MIIELVSADADMGMLPHIEVPSQLVCSPGD
jgi:hypothetical protein